MQSITEDTQDTITDDIEDTGSGWGILDSDTWHRRIENFIYLLIGIFIIWLIAQFFG